MLHMVLGVVSLARPITCYVETAVSLSEPFDLFIRLPLKVKCSHVYMRIILCNEYVCNTTYFDKLDSFESVTYNTLLIGQLC